MAAPKSNDQSFTSNWNKAVAWAQTQGISADSYLPVYQMDSARLQAGQAPMSAAERNRAILAAANPNNVTKLPSDNPQPSSILGNVRNDLGQIMTGLEPQHLISNLFHTVVNTAEDFIDPARLAGGSLEATAANVLQDTLLSFVPGAYDVGSFLRAGGGLKGIDALAEHPLVSLLDMIGTTKFLTGALADTALGTQAAEFAGTDAASLFKTVNAKGKLDNASAGKVLTRVLMNHVTADAPYGISPEGGGTIAQMSLGDRLQTWLGNSKLGTSKPIQNLLGDYMLNSHLATSIEQNEMAPAMSAFAALSPEDKQLFNQLMLRSRTNVSAGATAQMDNIESILNNDEYPITARDAMRKMINGPLRFEQEELLAMPLKTLSGDRAVTILRRPDGGFSVFTGKAADAVEKARSQLNDIRVQAVSSFDASDRLVQNVKSIDQRLPVMAQQLDQVNQAARTAAETDQDIRTTNVNVEAEGAPGQIVRQHFGRQSRQTDYMFGVGGAIETLSDALKKGDLDRVAAVAPILRSKLNEWGNHSVEASANPAFQSVRQAVDTVDFYVRRRHALNDEIDKRIDEEPTRVTAEVLRQREELKEMQSRQVSELEEQQHTMRVEYRDKRRQSLNKARSDRNVEVQRLRLVAKMSDQEDRERLTNANLRATPEQKKINTAETRAKITARAAELRRDVTAQDLKVKKSQAAINKAWDRNEGILKTKQETETAENRAILKAQGKNVGGELKRRLRSWTKAAQDFHQAVYDHPGDEWRDMYAQLYQEHLLASLDHAKLVDATFTRLRDKSGWDETRVQELQSDPVRLGEMVAVTANDIYQNQINWDPDLVDAEQRAFQEADNQAKAEINTLIAQGERPMWVPATAVPDGASSAIKATVGKGIPHVDIMHERTWQLVNTRYDVVAGVTKAVMQRLRRDATIDYVENNIVPRTITGDDLRDRLNALDIPLTFDPNVGTLTHQYTVELRNLGLTRFDSEDLFGFSFPRWEGKALYLPTPLVNALKELRHQEERANMGIFDKTTKLFRMSILGLSPRYTAHILFGGTFLLALRSTPYLAFHPQMILDAAKALREGDLPEEDFRTPSQEGFEPLQQALTQHARDSGHEMGILATQAQIARSFPEAWSTSKVSPFHWLKAAADVNFRFTRYVVKLQTSVAHLDYATSAERRGYFIDELTGERKVMTKERAMYEGMHHVLEVFGNLRNMSPIERQLAKNIMPFYGWTRHILNYVLSFPADHPWRAMVLALMAYEDSASVPEGLPERIQFLFFLGKPDAQGNVSAIDTRFMDPLRDVANYATLGGWLQALNPALLAPLAIMNPQAVYGSNELYPNITFNQFYGIETAGNQGNILTGLEQFVPQLGAFGSAIQAAGNYRKAAGTNPNTFYKDIFNSLNIPFAQVQKINVKQIAAHDEIARYQVAKQAAANAFDSGNFSSLAGYASVPNPLNPDYEISPAQLEAVYSSALAEFPGQAPVEVLAPPATPPGY